MKTRNRKYVPEEYRVAGAVGWQPCHHFWFYCLDNVVSSVSHNPIKLHACYGDSFTLHFVTFLLNSMFQLNTNLCTCRFRWKQASFNFYQEYGVSVVVADFWDTVIDCLMYESRLSCRPLCQTEVAIWLSYYRAMCSDRLTKFNVKRVIGISGEIQTEHQSHISLDRCCYTYYSVTGCLHQICVVTKHKVLLLTRIPLSLFIAFRCIGTTLQFRRAPKRVSLNASKGTP
jgi:hypothetical protein